MPMMDGVWLEVVGKGDRLDDKPVWRGGDEKYQEVGGLLGVGWHLR